MKEFDFAYKMAHARAETQMKMRSAFLDDFMKDFREVNPGADEEVYRQVRRLVKIGYDKGSVDTLSIMITTSDALEEGDCDD